MPISMSSAIFPQLRRVDELIKDKRYDEALEILNKLYDQGPNKDVMYRLADTLYLLGQKPYSYFIYERIHSLLEYRSPEYFELISTILSRFRGERFYPLIGYLARISHDFIPPRYPEDDEKPKFTIAGEDDDDEFIEDSDESWQKFNLDDFFTDFLKNELGLDDHKPFVTADEEKKIQNDNILLGVKNLHSHGNYREAISVIQNHFHFGIDSEDDAAAATAIGDNYRRLLKKPDAIAWYEKAIEYDGLNSQLYMRFLSLGKAYRTSVLEKSESVKILDAEDGIEIATRLFEYKEYKWSLYFVQKTREDFPNYRLPPLMLEYARYNNGDPLAKEEILEFFRKNRSVLPYMLISRGAFPSKIDLRRHTLPQVLMNKVRKEFTKLLTSKNTIEFTPELKRCVFFYLFDRTDEYFSDTPFLFDQFEVDNKYNNELVSAMLDCLNAIQPMWMVKEQYIYECIRRGYKGPITVMNNAYTHTSVDYLPEGFEDFPSVIKYGVINALAIIIADETYFNYYDIKSIVKKILDFYNKNGKLPRAISDPISLGQAIFIYKVDPTFQRRSNRNEFFDYKLEMPVPDVERLRRAIRKVMSTELS